MKKMYLKMETHRTGYAPHQCGETITVRELIDYLEDLCDDETLVFYSNDNGYTYGQISLDDIELDYYDEDDEDEE